MLLDCLWFSIFVIFVSINSTNSQPGTVCKSYDDVTKVGTCSGQTVIVENQFGSNSQCKDSIKRSQLDAIIEKTIQTNMQHLKEELEDLKKSFDNLNSTLMHMSSEFTDYCNPNPCENNGTCINRNRTFVCQCSDEYKGDRCSQRTCLNGTVYNQTCIKLPYTSGPALVYSAAQKVCQDMDADLIEITSRAMYDQAYDYVRTTWVSYTNEIWPACYVWLKSTFRPQQVSTKITLSNGTEILPKMPWFPNYPLLGYKRRRFTNLGVTVVKVQSTHHGLYNAPPSYPATPLCAYKL